MKRKRSRKTKKKTHSKPTVYIEPVKRTSNTYWAYKKKKGKKIPIKSGSAEKIFGYGNMIKKHGVKVKAKV